MSSECSSRSDEARRQRMSQAQEVPEAILKGPEKGTTARSDKARVEGNLHPRLLPCSEAEFRTMLCRARGGTNPNLQASDLFEARSMAVGARNSIAGSPAEEDPRHAAARASVAKGASLRQISRELGTSRETVRRWLSKCETQLDRLT